MYIVDTNILIFLLKKKYGMVSYLSQLNQDVFFISSMTRFEVEVGGQKDGISQRELINILDTFVQLPFDAKTVKIAVPLFVALGAKRHMFKDAMIAATAIAHNMTLITADKDFACISGLKYVLLALE